MLMFLLLDPKVQNFNFVGIYEYHFESLEKRCEGHL